MSDNLDRWSLWTRNVADKFKDVPTEKIKEELQRTAFPFAVMMAQLEGDFNFSSVVRSANAFNAKEVFFFGKKNWDRRGALGVQNYTPVKFMSSLDDIKALKERYTFVALENTGGTKPLATHSWAKNSLLIIGEESLGIPEEVLTLADEKVEITQYGSVRSLNAAVAASIAMYDYTSKFKG